MFVSRGDGTSVDIGDPIANSLRCRASNTSYLSRTFGTGNQAVFTFSAWVKRGQLGSIQGIFGAGLTSAGGPGATFLTGIRFDASDKLNVNWGSSGTGGTQAVSTAVFRDPTKPIHIVWQASTTTTTLWVNNVQVISASISGNGAINSAIKHVIGSLWDTTAVAPYVPLDGLISNVVFVDGQALTPSSFGRTSSDTGAWVNKSYSGTYGTTGFKLDFSNGTSLTTLGNDSSGNGNNWTLNNFSLTAGTTYDWLTDTPTNCYATLNPLALNGNSLSNGNLTATLAVSSGSYGLRSTLGILPSQKSVFQVKVTSANTWAAVGIQDINWQTGGTNYVYSAGSNCVLYYRVSGQKIVNGTTSAYSGNTFTTGDVIRVEVDYVNNLVEFFKNNTSQGTVALPSTSVTYVPVVTDVNNQNETYDLNFGQQPWFNSETPTAGFKALCTANLPDPAILKGQKHFDVDMFTGTASNVNITGKLFKPDLIWAKARSNAQGHELIDAVRGTSSLLQSNTTGAEVTLTNLPTFNSDGWTSTTDTHTNGYTYVDWLWNMGGSTVTNNAGSISSQVRANVLAGQSIVTTTGTGVAGTIGHGLASSKMMILGFNRDVAGRSHCVYHPGLTNAGYTLYLESTSAQDPNSAVWNSVAPTSSVFSVGTSVGVNESTKKHVFYCFAEIPGYSKIGTYTGNGSTSGPHVDCGGEIAFLMVKRTDTAGNDWQIVDSVRDPYNAGTHTLYADLSSAELTIRTFDLTSTGFVPRDNSGDHNASGGTYIFYAVLKRSTKYSNAR